MPESENIGIDYGDGRTNIAYDTGIRYGIIPARLLPYVYDDAESVYDADCPYCGDELPDDWDSALRDGKTGARACPDCGHDIDDGDDSKKKV